MRKSYLLAASIILSMCSCSSKENIGGSDPFLMEKGSVEQDNFNIAPKNKYETIGDVMPFYDNGKMNIFFLNGSTSGGLFYHPINLIVSEDNVHYENKGTVLPYTKDASSIEAALGTGSVYKDDNGLYHFYYTGHNSSSTSGLPYYEGICHATSSDLINWNKISDDLFYGTHNDFRDPFVYKYNNEYCMIVTTNTGSKGVLALYKSTDLSNWTYDSIFYEQADTYNMECPSIVNYDGYWYLFFSEQGEERVTRYRYKKNYADEWMTPNEDKIDTQGFYAGRALLGKDNRFFIYGWCAEKQYEWDAGNFDWGGNLICHELDSLANGQLLVKPPKEYNAIINHEVGYYQSNGKYINSIRKNGEYEFESLSENVTHLSFNITIKDTSGYLLLNFGREEHKLSATGFVFDFSNGKLIFKNDINSLTDLGNDQLVRNYNFQANKTYVIDMYIDGNIAMLYINKSIGMTTRMYLMPVHEFAFILQEADIKIASIKFYE